MPIQELRSLAHAEHWENDLRIHRVDRQLRDNRATFQTAQVSDRGLQYKRWCRLSRDLSEG
ncbi:MAG: hypothetical protein RIG66_16870 [Coleofasciculus sp. E2-BRE-01]